jgi:hypothetical protein
MHRLSSVIKNWLQLTTNFIINPKLGVIDTLNRINKMGRGFFLPAETSQCRTAAIKHGKLSLFLSHFWIGIYNFNPWLIVKNIPATLPRFFLS